MQKYYHLSEQNLSNKIEPKGFYEEVKDGELQYWYPLSNTPPIFFLSDVPESCFATTIEGALFGVCSDGCKPTKIHVHSTNEKPDVDLTDEMVQDFGVINEVRYRRPVDIKKECDFFLPEDIISKIEKCQIETDDGEVFFNDECGLDVKNKIRKWLQKNTVCYE